MSVIARATDKHPATVTTCLVWGACLSRDHTQNEIIAITARKTITAVIETMSLKHFGMK